jgi:hypothetical protein
MIRRQSAALLTAVKTEKRSKYTPESDKVSQTEAKTILTNGVSLLETNLLC